MMFKLENHIPGKVYDLTQENMQAMIEAIERLQEEVVGYKTQAMSAGQNVVRLQAENAKLRESLEAIADSLSCTGEDAGWMIEEARQALAAQEE